MNLVVFASVSPSIRSADIKLQDVQRNMSKMTSCSIKLLSQLPNILKTNRDHKDEKLASQTILDGIKISEYATQNLLSWKKKCVLSGVRSECKGLAKSAEDTNSHLFGEEIEGSLKNTKGRHYRLQAVKPMINYQHASAKQKFHKISKNDRPAKRPMVCRKGITQYNSPSTWVKLKKQPSTRSQYKNHRKYGRNWRNFGSDHKTSNVWFSNGICRSTSLPVCTTFEFLSCGNWNYWCRNFQTSQ